MTEKMTKKVSPSRFGFYFIVLLGSLFVGFYLHYLKSQPTIKPGDLTGTLLSTPRPIGAFHLQDNLGNTYTEKSLQGHWTIMFFGFTSCQYVCPTTMTELNQAYSMLGHFGLTASLPDVVMVSVDPKRDNVKKMDHYVKSFNHAFKGAIGSEQETAKLAGYLSVLYMKTDKSATPAKANDDIDHSGAVMLIDPKARLQAFFSMPHNAASLAKDWAKIILNVRV